MTATAPPVAPAATRTASSSGVGRSGSVAWMVLPALFMFLLFGVVPLIGVFVLSFAQWDGLGAITVAGISNWKSVLKDPGLLHSLWVTFEIIGLSWLVQTPISLLLGTFLAGRQKYRGFLAVLPGATDAAQLTLVVTLADGRTVERPLA